MTSLRAQLRAIRAAWLKLRRRDGHPVNEGIAAVKYVAGVVGMWFGFTSVAFAFFYIPSESMQPSLEVGDRIVVSKWAYGYSRHSLPLGLEALLPESWDGHVRWAVPRRGDVVVVQDGRQNLTLIKRVVGLPGDVIEVRAGRLYLNGAQVEREPVEVRTYRQHRGYPEIVRVMEFEERLPGGVNHSIYERDDGHYLDEFGPQRVPANHVFLMGDNRDNSIDSRANDGPGMVELSRVIGRAETVYFTLKRCNRDEGLDCPTGRVWRDL